MPPLVEYRIQSKNTLFYLITKESDKAGQQVDTLPSKGSIPPNSIPAQLYIHYPTSHSFFFVQVLFLNCDVGHDTVTPSVTIKEMGGLYVSLPSTDPNTKLTWSEEPYTWMVRKTLDGSYVVTPSDSTDLYWFDEFNVGVGDHVEVWSGSQVKPPQNEWIFTE